MTVGSRDTRVQTNIGQTMSGNPTWILNGAQVSWSGTDSAVKRRLSGMTKKERIAYFLEKPKSQLNRPYRTVKVPMDTAAVAKMFSQGNLFEQVREKRFKLLEEPDPGDYRQPHPYTKSWQAWRESLIRWGDGGSRLWYGTWVSQYTGSITMNGWWPSTSFLQNTGTWKTENDAKLLERLREKVVGSDFNLASFLGAEGLDTLSFIGDVAHRIARSMVLAKRGQMPRAIAALTSYGRVSPRERAQNRDLASQRDVYSAIARANGASRQHAGVIAGQWLEYHLAAEPLVGDVIAASEQLAHITGVKRTQRIRASVTQTTKYPQNVPSTPRWSGYRRIQKSVVGYFVVAPEPVAFMGLTDPEVTIWNAIPMSFVADYFFDIGGWLEARATASAFGTATYVTSVKDEWQLGDCTGMNVPNGNHYRIPDALDISRPSYRYGTFSRSISSSLSDLVKKPRFEPLGALKNWQRAATAVSLVAAFSSRSSQPPMWVMR